MPSDVSGSVSSAEPPRPQARWEWLSAPAGPMTPRSWFIPALTAVALLLVAYLIERTTGTTVPLLLVVAVGVAAWYLGLGGALAATAICGLVLVIAVFPPSNELSVTDGDDLVRIGVFGFVSLVTTAAVLALGRSRVQAQQLVEDRERLVAELRSLADAKDEFLSLVSHELRTPITMIKGNAELLFTRWEQVSATDRTAAFKDIVSESERLHRIIENLLLLARAEAGRGAEAEPVLVVRVVERVIRWKEALQPERRWTVRQHGSPRPVICVEVYLEQVIENLLANAMKYSPPHAPIDIEIERTTDDVILRVLDRGQGLDPTEGDVLFEPFYRSRRTRPASGVGVGLAVCKRLIEAQGGEMWAHPRDGGGAEFGFRLPVARPEAQPADEEPREATRPTIATA